MSCLLSYAGSTKKVGENDTNILNCPVCRKCFHTDSIDSWIKTLRSSDMHCDSCERQCTSCTAVWFCQDCSDNLCDQCFKFHKSNRSSMGHVTRKLEDNRESVYVANLFCNKHIDRRLDVYCFDHDIPCCSMCATFNHRKCEHISPLNECSKAVEKTDEKSSFKTMTEITQNKLKKALKTFEECKTTCKEKAEKLQAQVNFLTENIIRRLQEDKSGIIIDLSAIEKEYLINIELKSAPLEKACEILTKSEQLLNPANKIDDITMFLEIKRMQRELNPIQKILQNLEILTDAFEPKMAINRYFDEYLSGCFNVAEVYDNVERCKTYSSKMSLFGIALAATIRGYKTNCRFTDAEFVAKESIIAVCGTTNAAYLYTLDGSLIKQHKLSGSPWAIAKIAANQFAISIKSPPAVEILYIKETFVRTDNVIKLPWIPFGITTKGPNVLIVTSGKRIVYIARDGTVITSHHTGAERPYGLCVNPEGQIIMTDYDGAQDVTFFKSIELEEVKNFKHPMLKSPSGVACDIFGNVYVSGFNSHNVFQLNKNGSIVRVLLENKEKLKMKNPIGLRVEFVKSSLKMLLTSLDSVLIFNFHEGN
ncbi:uncharacterized protein LOC134229930 [Saccostrea cucullata]|uniref:uncharacterized protein LOC134229930 n=1 Tax=Saccostrea cuccullata TaxID=36930 RepID=UPI002ED3B807